MYPLHCYGGHAMPIRTGKFSIVAVAAKPETLTDTLEFSLWDTGSNSPVNSSDLPVDAQRIAHFESDDSTSLFVSFPEPLKVRNGISVGDGANLDGGKLFVYVR